MVNSLLYIVSIVTFVVWLVQEIVGRRQLKSALSWCADYQKEVPAESLISQVVPGWWRTSYYLVLTLWFAWFASILLVKDGDFALALVILTGLAGVIAVLDRFVFEKRRWAFVSSGQVAVYLKYQVRENIGRLKHAFAGQLPVAENARAFFPVLFVVLVLRSFVVEPFQIPSASMVPTLEVGDFILVNKFSYGLRLPVVGTKIVDVGEPQRGDVMVFFPPHDERYFIKRVIGLPGDRIEYRDKMLYINGERVPKELLMEVPPLDPVLQVIREDLGDVEHLIHHDMRIDRGDFAVTVKPGHYFMMGDNRDNSSDSRVWGQVPESNIVGKAFAIWMHWPSFGELPSFDRVGAIQ